MSYLITVHCHLNYSALSSGSHELQYHQKIQPSIQIQSTGYNNPIIGPAWIDETPGSRHPSNIFALIAFCAIGTNICIHLCVSAHLVQNFENQNFTRYSNTVV